MFGLYTNNKKAMKKKFNLMFVRLHLFYIITILVITLIGTTVFIYRYNATTIYQ